MINCYGTIMIIILDTCKCVTISQLYNEVDKASRPRWRDVLVKMGSRRRSRPPSSIRHTCCSTCCGMKYFPPVAACNPCWAYPVRSSESCFYKQMCIDSEIKQTWLYTNRTTTDITNHLASTLYWQTGWLIQCLILCCSAKHRKTQKFQPISAFEVPPCWRILIEEPSISGSGYWTKWRHFQELPKYSNGVKKGQLRNSCVQTNRFIPVQPFAHV